MRRSNPFEPVEPAEPLLREIKGQHDQRLTLNLEPLIPFLLVCQTYVTPCLMKSWSVSFGDFHPSGRIGKQL